MSSDSSLDVLVIGGGISGLAAGVFAKAKGLSVLVVEKSDRFGGAIETHRQDGYLYENGPNSTLMKVGPFTELVEIVGLTDRVLPGSKVANKRFVWFQDHPEPLPMSPLEFLTTPLLSLRDKLYVMGEPFRRRSQDMSQESIADFVTRRLGRGMLENFIDPFVSGVYAGDPERLAVELAVAKIAALEKEYGSLIRGALARRKGPAPAGKLVSFPDGMEELPRACVAFLGDAAVPSVTIEGIDKGVDAFRVRINGVWMNARNIIVTSPPHSVAELFSPLFSDEKLAALSAVPYPPVGILRIGLPRERVSHPLDGFGYLIPGKYKFPLLGTLFSSSLFPGRAPENHILLTAFSGGRRHEAWLRADPASARTEVTEMLADHLGFVPQDIVFSSWQYWDRAIPQYEFSHYDVLATVDHLEATYAGLYFSGNWVRGISVGDCVAQAATTFSRIKGVRKNAES